MTRQTCLTNSRSQILHTTYFAHFTPLLALDEAFSLCRRLRQDLCKQISLLAFLLHTAVAVMISSAHANPGLAEGALRKRSCKWSIGLAKRPLRSALRPATRQQRRSNPGTVCRRTCASSCASLGLVYLSHHWLFHYWTLLKPPDRVRITGRRHGAGGTPCSHSAEPPFCCGVSGRDVPQPAGESVSPVS